MRVSVSPCVSLRPLVLFGSWRRSISFCGVWGKECGTWCEIGKLSGHRALSRERQPCAAAWRPIASDGTSHASAAALSAPAPRASSPRRGASSSCDGPIASDGIGKRVPTQTNVQGLLDDVQERARHRRSPPCDGPTADMPPLCTPSVRRQSLSAPRPRRRVLLQVRGQRM